VSTILRFIIVKTTADRAADVERIWAKECGPLMRKRSGCVREELLRCLEEPGEFISVAEWESQKAIDDYRASAECERIKQHTRGTTGMAATVKTYEVIKRA
jgi:heme-degrading monooxygenase HmoA